MFDKPAAERVVRATQFVERLPGRLLAGRDDPRFPQFIVGGAPESDDPWEIFQWTPPSGGTASTYWRNVRVHRGYVNGISTTGTTKVHEQDPLLPTGTPAGSVYDILVPESTTDYCIWGKVTYTREVACSQQEASIAVESVIIEHGADWWTDHPSQYPADGVFYFEIGTVTTGVDSPQWLDEPTNTEPNPDWHSLDITQIADGDQRIVPWATLDVTLETDGGSAGDDDTAGDYTYKATDCCGIVVGAGLIPVHSVARFIGAQLTAATVGVVRLNCAGQVVLWDSDEAPAVHDCDEEE